MADFLKAHAKTAVHEAGYVNHPADKGGETWAGVTRKNHPAWPGWAVVERIKRESRISNVIKSTALDALLVADKELAGHVASLYKAKYWDTLGLDAEPSQAIAEKAFDIAVNMGPGVGKKFLAEARE